MEKTGDNLNLAIIKNLAPFLWPKGNFTYRIRVVFAFLSLILAKIFTVFIPISLIWVVDSFNVTQEQEKYNPYYLMTIGSLRLIIIYNFF